MSRRSHPTGMTLVELLVVVAILVTLCGILMPVVAGAKYRAYASETLSNLRQIATARGVYDGDQDAFDGRAHRLVAAGVCPAALMASRFDVSEPGLANIYRSVSPDAGSPVTDYKDSMLVLPELVGASLVPKVRESDGSGWLVVGAEPVADQLRRPDQGLDLLAASLSGRYLRLTEGGSVIRRQVRWAVNAEGERYTSHTWLFTDDAVRFR